MSKFSYKGQNKSSNYFEGWYTKLVDTNNNLSYAIIFGITLYENDPHSFIQIINNKTEKSNYLRFGVNDFAYSDKSITIKDNVLSPYELKLNTKDLIIDIKSDDFELLERSALCPGVMGFLKYMPLCAKHEIIYLKARSEGNIKENEEEYYFDGSSYMEKNWGNKFPNKWLWSQTNHFENSNAKLVLIYTKVSIFDIPAFFCVLTVAEKEYRFASYNNSHIKILKLNKDNIILNVSKGELKLNIKINYNEEYPLIAPIKNGRMIKVIGESINSTLSLSLYKNAKVIFRDNATNVGCENLLIDN